MRTRTIVISLVSVVILAALAIVFIPQLLKPEQVTTQTYWPTQGWRTSTPEEQGFDSAKLAEGLQAMQESHISIDSLLVIRNGYVVLDAYFYPYDGSFPHDLASVTKSFMTTLIGIAADQGKLQLDQPMVSLFADRTIANLDARKERMTIQHLAGMANGFASGCLSGDEPTLDGMRSNPDWVQSALDRKLVREPGTSFCYDSPGMHLLSAILQEATGMTALDFARQYLFEPLGISEVAWEADPQGYTHGWGDLHLQPSDAAKLGYLWLNQGIWEGKQIVSASWVAESSKTQTTAADDDYGYGWWVSSDSFYAMGRGGQSIKVMPPLNLVVVTTGAGFEFDQIVPFLLAAFVDPEKPLPANQEGLAELDTILAALLEGPAFQTIASLPDTPQAISGKSYVCEPNPAGVTSMRLEFNDPEVASMFLRLNERDVTWLIGLDGKYRLSSDGKALWGYWEDPQTFVIKIFDIGLQTLRLHFEGDQLEVRIPEEGLTLEGQLQKP